MIVRAQLIVGITSAGRVSPSLPLPSIVIVDDAVRDEGTSLHYLAPSSNVLTPTPGVIDPLLRELSTVSPHVCRGCVWTTDAPYRETAEQLRFWADRGALAVEMQAASLFAFARAREAHVAMVALVSNSVDQTVADFDTGGDQYRVAVLSAVARAAAPSSRREPPRRRIEAAQTDPQPYRSAAEEGANEMPGCCCSPFECAANQQFNHKKVARELKRYRQKGPGPTTRLLVDGIARSAKIEGTLLDIGSGIGALTFALVERGASSAVAVDASAAYINAARDEATRRGHSDAIRFVHADFVVAASELPSASVVTLDRVVLLSLMYTSPRCRGCTR
jgi:Phosphorylase superfamily/Methyltransferase domain